MIRTQNRRVMALGVFEKNNLYLYLPLEAFCSVVGAVALVGSKERDVMREFLAYARKITGTDLGLLEVISDKGTRSYDPSIWDQDGKPGVKDTLPWPVMPRPVRDKDLSLVVRSRYLAFALAAAESWDDVMFLFRVQDMSNSEIIAEIEKAALA